MFSIEKFKELLSVPSKTYQEEDMVEYLCGELDTISGVSYYRDEMMNLYVTKGELSEGEFYPMFVSHTDTVHNKIDKIFVKEEKLKRPNTFGKNFGDDLTDVLKAYDKDNNPTGIGGDDKCGIFICLELLKTLDKVKVGFFVSEETGCHGSSKCDENFLKDVGYITQYDAPGNHLITEICSGIRLFDNESEFYQKALKAITEGFNNEMYAESHPYTDVSQLKMKSDVSCINMSCGYYNMHSNQEFVSIDDVKCAIEAGKNMVSELGYNKYEFLYKPLTYKSFPKSVFDFDEDDDFGYFNEEDYHKLETIDVIEESDGILLTDAFDGVGIFINDEDCLNLFEVLKNRILKKY